ncbi:MAG: methyltransferase type 11 [Rhodospirillaceae bacterium]|nr:methyltransferase type 11 [Rhodospirillaceae bacterium]
MFNQMKAEYFHRIDETDDAIFYGQPRLVKHIDDSACVALTNYFRMVLPADSDLLDLMSSCFSHLPEELSYKSVTGLGMNKVELDGNPQLTSRVVHNLTNDPTLPFDDHTFDGCVVTVSVQYLVNPVVVFQEIGRVLRPRSPCIISFSNRCFPTKAVAVWHNLDDQDRAKLVGHYFVVSKKFGPYEVLNISPKHDKTDPLFVVCAKTAP